jgi:hypothetical protein
LFARTITIEARPSVVDDTLRLIREQVYPVTEQRPGMLGALLLADRTKGRIVSITLWETEESMRADDTGKLLQQRHHGGRLICRLTWQYDRVLQRSHLTRALPPF